MKLTGENRQLGEKPVPVPLYPPQISHGLDLGPNPGLRGERPATNRLSHGTARSKHPMRNLCCSTDVRYFSVYDFYERGAPGLLFAQDAVLASVGLSVLHLLGRNCLMLQ
jgi:hypothetical protein